LKGLINERVSHPKHSTDNFLYYQEGKQKPRGKPFLDSLIGTDKNIEKYMSLMINVEEHFLFSLLLHIKNYLYFDVAFVVELNSV